MYKYIIALLLLVAVSGPAMADITFTGGDGSSFDKAIIINGAKGEDDGVASEYQWIRHNKAGYRPGGQALFNKNGHAYDVLSIKLGKGDKQDIYFDITQYFGKY